MFVCLFVVVEMFLEVALFLETSSVLENLWVQGWSNPIVGWQRKLLDIYSLNYFILWNLSISYFIQMTLRISIKIYFNSNTNVHIFLLPMWKINNIPGRGNPRKTWLLIRRCRSFEPPSSIDKPIYGQAPFLFFLGNIVQMKYR